MAGFGFHRSRLGFGNEKTTAVIAGAGGSVGMVGFQGKEGSLLSCSAHRNTFY